MKTQLKFTFYKDNKISQSFELNEVALKEKFKAWLQSKENSWLEYYCFQLSNIFISDKDGLSSTMDNQQCYDKIEFMLKEYKWEYLNSIGID